MSALPAATEDPTPIVIPPPVSTSYHTPLVAGGHPYRDTHPPSAVGAFITSLLVGGHGFRDTHCSSAAGR